MTAKKKREEVWRINAKPSAFVLEKQSFVKGRELWTPELWYSDPVAMAKSLLRMKASSIINVGDGNLIEAIEKAHAEIVYLIKEAAPLEPFVLEWAEKLKEGGDDG